LNTISQAENHTVPVQNYPQLRKSYLNKVVLPALPLSIALFPFSPLGQSWDIGEAYLRSLEGAGLGFGIMLLVYIASRGARAPAT
jgi:hypothetical protein